MHHKLCNLTPTQWSTDPRQAVLPIDVVGVNVEGAARATPVLDRLREDAPALVPRGRLRRKAVSQTLVAAIGNQFGTCNSSVVLES